MKAQIPAFNVISFQVTNACQLRCKYCYTRHESGYPLVLSKEIASRAVDYFLQNRNRFNAPAVSLDFIGGEPLLFIELIEDIINYFKEQCHILQHPWEENYSIRVTTNGLLYNSTAVQSFINRHRNRLNISITLDGCKTKHDQHRVYEDGSGSYDDVARNVPLWTEQFPNCNTKITFARNDMPYLAECITNIWSMNIKHINVGFVSEDDWQTEDAILFEKQLRLLADIILEKGLNDGRRLPFFSPDGGQRILETKGGNGTCEAGEIVTVGIDGKLYPCPRFAPGSQDKHPPRPIGDIEKGINDNLLRPFKTFDRRLFSPVRCTQCTTDTSCAWCHAANYYKSETPTIFQPLDALCEIYKVQARVNKDFWARTKSEGVYHG